MHILSSSCGLFLICRGEKYVGLRASVINKCVGLYRSIGRKPSLEAVTLDAQVQIPVHFKPMLYVFTLSYLHEAGPLAIHKPAS